MFQQSKHCKVHKNFACLSVIIGLLLFHANQAVGDDALGAWLRRMECNQLLALHLEKYLEIGCDDDLLFSKIIVNKKVGVDPKSGGNVRKTSDEFFKTNIEKFDLIFIDGLHEYDQVKKDIKNSLNFLNHDGLILVHDCLPAEMSCQAVPRYRHFWLGDVWKAIVFYRKEPNLNIYTCKIDTGISVIKKEVNDTIINLTIKDCKKLKFKDFYNNYEKFMRLYEYDKFLEKVLD